VDGSFVDWGGSDSVSSVRARGGFAHQRILIYATGGIAFRDLVDDPGWIVGGGIEYAVSDNWVVGAEYLYSEFDPGVSDVFRGRVSYLFGGFGGTTAALTSAAPLAFNWTGFYLGAHGGYGFVDGAGLTDSYEVGGQVGVNRQYGRFVIGMEMEGGFVDWGQVTEVGSIRLRGGYALDRFLVFAAGGMGIEDSIGWTVGGGAEYALSDHWTVGGEYLYHDFRGGHTAHIVRGRVSYLFDTVGGL
jgi:outer membrane immunogenic protein